MWPQNTYFDKYECLQLSALKVQERRSDGPRIARTHVKLCEAVNANARVRLFELAVKMHTEMVFSDYLSRL
jgi:hypothetical protein